VGWREERGERERAGKTWRKIHVTFEIAQSTLLII
jgi:hypothetical protein